MTELPQQAQSAVDADVHEALGRFFGSHNARSVRTQELVDSFVPSTPWDELIKPRNHLLVGPRGAGKTHLLKMLTPKALGLWQHAKADATRAQVDYPAALVLSDRHWHAQLLALTDGLNDDLAINVQKSALTLAVIKALVECAGQRLAHHHLPLTLDKDTEADLWRSVAIAWDFPPAGSLRLLSDHITTQSRRLYRHTMLAKETGDVGQLRELSVFGLDAHFAAQEFVERVNSYANDPERRWALLFDEVELASWPLRTYIEQLLRGGSQELLIKISLAPYTESGTVINTPFGGMAGHDFEPISLTYPEKKAARQFTIELMEQRLKTLNVSTPVDDLLGPSDLDESEGSEYGGLNTYQRLAKRDPTFASYLAEKGIDLDHLDEVSGNRRSAWLRKPRGAISIREAYGFKVGGGRRSAQLPYPFTGTTGISAVLEGNARWILGLTEKLFEAGITEVPIPKATQAGVVQRAAESYHTFLAMLPHPSGSDSPAGRQPVELADLIGEYFYTHVVDHPFRAEPPTTFRVPDNVAADILAALQTLLHTGALIHIPDSENQVAIGKPVGLRFRLTYLLAPKHPFPLRVSKSVSLDQILSGAPIDQMHLDQEDQTEQVDIPSEDAPGSGDE